MKIKLKSLATIKDIVLFVDVVIINPNDRQCKETLQHVFPPISPTSLQLTLTLQKQIHHLVAGLTVVKRHQTAVRLYPPSIALAFSVHM